MKRVMLTVAYDGTNYNGWQLQPNADTIEARLNTALSDLLKEDINVIGASRTDAGVHAYGNVAVFDTNTQMPADKISYALNQRLPEDIRIQDSREVDADFHPRHCDSRKTYVYNIYNAKFPQPVNRLYAYFTYNQLDVDKMKRACEYFIGEHDFASFCSVGSQAKTTVRTIYDLHIEQNGQMLSIYVTGSGFLYNMVRIIAGTLMEVGRGKLELGDVVTIIDSKDRSKAGPTAPACGLALYKYEFENMKK